jgi:hypothetical protein
MKSFASLEGEYLIDNSNSPGVAEELMLRDGIPKIAAKKRWEEAVYTCGHCEFQVVKERNRTRPRGVCFKCSHILCDVCDAEYHASGHVCTNFKHMIEELREQAELARQAGAESVAIIIPSKYR